MKPIVKFGVFGVGNSWLVCSSDDRCLIHDMFSDSICPKLSYYRSVCKAVYEISSLVDEVHECDELNNLKRYASDLCESINEQKIDDMKLKMSGGFCWKDENEARHVVELMDLYHRVSENENGLTIRPPNPEDYKLFKTFDERWKGGKKNMLVDYNEMLDGYYGINLVFIEVIYKWHEITNEVDFPDWLSELIINCC